MRCASVRVSLRESPRRSGGGPVKLRGGSGSAAVEKALCRVEDVCFGKRSGPSRINTLVALLVDMAVPISLLRRPRATDSARCETAMLTRGVRVGPAPKPERASQYS